MWNAFDQIQGWSIGKVYEISHFGSNSFKAAIKAWQKSQGHHVVLAGVGGWGERTKKGGCWTDGNHTNCYFSA